MWHRSTEFWHGIIYNYEFHSFLTAWKPVGYNESAQKGKKWNDFASGKKGWVIPHPQL